MNFIKEAILLAIFLFLGISLVPVSTYAATTISSNISTNTTWTTAGDGIYIINNSVAVDSGVTLTIDPGVIVKVAASKALTVNGTLNAIGSSTAPIYFTSLKDDSIGGDTNGDGSATSPAAGDWYYVYVSSGATATIEHAMVRYGGKASLGAVRNNAGTLTMKYSSIATSSTRGMVNNLSTASTTLEAVTIQNHAYGVYVFDGTVRVASSTFENNTTGLYAASTQAVTIENSTFVNNGTTTSIFLSNGLVFAVSNNTATGTGIRGHRVSGSVETNQTWFADAVPYVADNVSVAVGKTLTIDPGALFKFDSSKSLTVYGSLEAPGTLGSPIYFTSLKDDTLGGDTNGNGTSTTPAAGDWGNIAIQSASSTASIHHAVVRYAGSTGAVRNNAGTLILKNAVVATSSSSGIFNNLSTASTTIAETDVFGHTYGIYNYSGNITIASSTVRDGTYGIYQDSAGTGTTTVVWSVLRDNSSYGAYNGRTSTSTFTAENNYWNATTGPYQTLYNPLGTGDRASNYVDFISWLGVGHYVHAFDSVDDANEELLWSWATSSTQYYADQWDAAVATWNALDPIDISEATSTSDLEIEEANVVGVIWTGLYEPPFEDEIATITLNLEEIGTDPLTRIQKTWTHELGHALGLDHSYWENIMYYQRTTQTTLGVQDVSDYHYLWGY